MRWLAPLAILVLLAGCVAPAPPAEPAPEGAPAQPWDAPARPGLPPLLHLPKADGVSDGSEPSILTDRNGRYVWIGDTSGGYLSENNGTSWQAMPNLALGIHLLGDGWALAQDDAGSLYAADLSENHIDVGRSDDGGHNWATTAYAAGVFDSVDRPWLAATGQGEVTLFYVAALGVLVGPDEHCARSTDGGATFLDQRPLGATPQGGKGFADSQGRVYFANDQGILYRFETCLGGATQVKMLDPGPNNNMLQGDALGTDLYMAATDADGAIRLAGSHDGGHPRTLAVSPPGLATNTYATLSAWGDEVAVAWYGSTASGDPFADGFGGDFDVYLAVVRDFWGTPTVAQFRLTGSPNHHGAICAGGIGCTGNRGLLDYFMVDHDKWGGLHVAYVDDTGEDGAPGVRYLHVPPLNATVRSEPGGPVARFSASVAGNRITADASASGPGNLTFAWEWGDGAAGTGAKASHDYATFGAYQVTLTVKDEQGRTSVRSQGFVVDSPPPATPAATTTSTSSTPTSAPTTTPPKATAQPKYTPTTTGKKTPEPGLVPVAVALLALALRRRH